MNEIRIERRYDECTAARPRRRPAPAVPVAAPGPTARRPRRVLGVIRHPSPRALATLALVGATLLWGTSTAATKPMLGHLPPLTLALLRILVALAVLLPATRRTGQRPARGWMPALLGLTGVALSLVCQNLGMRHAGAADAALILNGGIPVLTLLLAALALRERPTGHGLVGVVASLAGVATLARLGPAGGQVDGPGVSLAGGALLLASAATFAAYTVLGRRAFAGAAPLGTVAGAFGYGALFLLPVAGLDLVTTAPSRPPLQALPLLLYLAAGCSALAFLLAGHALARLEAGRVAVMLNLQLVIGVAVAVLLLDEPLTRGHVAGGGLILAGAWLAGSRPPRRAPPAPATAAPTTASGSIPPRLGRPAPFGPRAPIPGGVAGLTPVFVPAWPDRLAASRAARRFETSNERRKRTLARRSVLTLLTLGLLLLAAGGVTLAQEITCATRHCEGTGQPETSSAAATGGR